MIQVADVGGTHTRLCGRGLERLYQALGAPAALTAAQIADAAAAGRDASQATSR